MEVRTKAFLARLPSLTDDQRVRVEAWVRQRCARGAVVEVDRGLFLLAERETARTVKMNCRLTRAALKRCGVVVPSTARQWLVYLSTGEFEAYMRQHAAPPTAGAADRVVDVSSAPPVVATETGDDDDDTRVIVLPRKR